MLTLHSLVVHTDTGFFVARTAVYIFRLFMLTSYILVTYTDLLYSYYTFIFLLLFLTWFVFLFLKRSLYILVTNIEFVFYGCFTAFANSRNTNRLSIFFLLIRTLYILVANADFVYSGCFCWHFIFTYITSHILVTTSNFAYYCTYWLLEFW